MSDLIFEKVLSIENIPVFFLNNVASAQKLSKIIYNLSSLDQNLIAIDQERAPYHKVYFQKPSILQIATTDSIFLLDLQDDPLILGPLKEIFENKNLLKIFFDAPWDIFYLLKFFKIKIKGIFDIKIAASLLYPKKGTISLIELVEKELRILNFEKSKKQQKSDWTIRPLTKKQLSYASNEISVYIPLYQQIMRKLRQRKLISFVKYGHSRLYKELPNLKYNPYSIQKIHGFENLLNQEKYKLFQLGILRDKIARERNKPSNYVLTNAQLIKLLSKTLNEVKTTKQYFSNEERVRIKQIQNSIYPNEPFKSPKITNFNDLPELQQKLLIWRNNLSKELEIPKKLLFSKKDIETLDYSSKEQLLEAVWFNSKSNLIKKRLFRSLESFL